MPSINMYVPRYDPRGDQTQREHPAGHPSVFQPTTALNYSLPTDVATLHSIINNLLELQATTTANTNLAACLAIARVQTEQAPFTPTTPTTPTTTPNTTTTPSTTPTTAPLPCPHPNHSCMVASGRGAASPEVFKEIIKTNWHGRLGRTHMVDVDALSDEKLAELDSFLRQKLNTIFPRGKECSDNATTNSGETFTQLISVGLRLEDRGRYGERYTSDSLLQNEPTLRRGREYTAWYYSEMGTGNYWRGCALETIIELARYRGLFNDEGFLKIQYL